MDRLDYILLDTEGLFRTCPLCFGLLIFDDSAVTFLNNWAGYHCSQCGTNWTAWDLVDAYNYDEL